jgi:hypothetical protein
MASAATFAPTVDAKRQALETIAATNAERCNIPQVLDALEITVGTVPSINLYIFELLQNALDAGASRVSVRHRYYNHYKTFPQLLNAFDEKSPHSIFFSISFISFQIC